MKQIEIIPFDWEYYQANKDKCRVITSHGIPKYVSELTKFETLDKYCLVGVIDNEIWAWLLNGAYSLSNQYAQRNLRLEVTEEVVESWVNVYESEDGERLLSNMFRSKEEALQCKSTILRYICTIPLHELKSDEA